jgi:hypothetical protein
MSFLLAIAFSCISFSNIGVNLSQSLLLNFDYKLSFLA